MLSDLFVRRIKIEIFEFASFRIIGAVQAPLQSTQRGRVTRGRHRYLLLKVRPRADKIAPCDVAGAKILLNAALRAAAGPLRTSASRVRRRVRRPDADGETTR